MKLPISIILSLPLIFGQPLASSAQAVNSDDKPNLWQQAPQLGLSRENVPSAKRVGQDQYNFSYTYIAPNGCWNLGGQTLDVNKYVAKLKFDVTINLGFCTQALKPLKMDVWFDGPKSLETLEFEVHDQEGQLIETQQLLIE